MPGELGGSDVMEGRGLQGPLQQQSNSASQELVAAGSHTPSVIPDTVGGALLTRHPGSADAVTSGRALLCPTS